MNFGHIMFMGNEMIYLTAYLAGFLGFIATMAIRLPNAELREALLWAAIWPIALLFAILLGVFKLFKWTFDFRKNKNQKFGIRKPSDGWPGVAITLFYIEFLFWKIRPRN